MKYILLKLILISLFVISNYSYSQQWNGYNPDESDALYVKAIKEYIINHEFRPNRYIKLNKSEKTLYLIGEQALLDLPDEIDGFSIVLIWPNNRWKYFEENNNRLVVLELIPLVFENSKFYIDIKQMVTTMTNPNEINYERMGMEVTSYFKFENGKMIFDCSETSGAY